MKQELLPLVDAIQRVTGQRVHISTALRWCQKPNKHNLKLKSWLFGGRRMTTEDAVEEFVRGCTNADVAAPPVASIGAVQARAMTELDRMGV